MSGRIGAEDREVYRGLVEVLLPAASGMPSGIEVGVADAGLDRVLGVRADLAAELLEVLRQARGKEAGAAVKSFQEENGVAWHALRLVAFGAYYLSAPVQQGLGYTGQPASPYDPDKMPSFVETGLIDAVVARGRLWRSPENK